DLSVIADIRLSLLLGTGFLRLRHELPGRPRLQVEPDHQVLPASPPHPAPDADVGRAHAPTRQAGCLDRVVGCRVRITASTVRAHPSFRSPLAVVFLSPRHACPPTIRAAPVQKAGTPGR